MSISESSAAREAARGLAADLARARAHWGIPERSAVVAPQALTPAARLPLIIERYRAGVEVAQIAAELGVPADTIGTQIYRARRAGKWPEDLRRGRA